MFQSIRNFLVRFGKGIRIRIMLPVILFLVIEAVFFLYLHHRYMANLARKTIHQDTVSLLSSIRAAIEHPMTTGDEESIRELLKNVSRQSEVKIYIADPEGVITYAPSPGEEDQNLWEKVPQEIASLGQRQFQTREDTAVKILKEGERGEFFGLKLIKNQKACFHCHGSSREVLGLVLVRGDITPALAIERKSVRSFSFLAVAILAFSVLLLTLLLQKIAIKPIRALCAKLKELSVGEADLTRELPVRKINCSEEMRCDYPECRSYGQEVPCWYVSGSYSLDPDCPKISEGHYRGCEDCLVYQKALRTEIEEAASFVNAFLNRMRQMIGEAKAHAENVGLEAQKLNKEAEVMSQIATDTKEGARSLLTSAERTNQMVENVVRAMEEMNGAVVEISRNTSLSREKTSEATEKARQAVETIKNLSEASEKIGEISQLIGNIAEQTNLLALNATIEASRAGEAGKGFAVVANEVKELARKTSESVEVIDKNVNRLKGDVQQAVTAINEILQVIEELNHMAQNIASAVEEQTATTGEISASAQQAGETVAETTRLIDGITQRSGKAYESSNKVKEAAHKLNRLFKELQELLSSFKI